jgi:hypothetical protein
MNSFPDFGVDCRDYMNSTSSVNAGSASAGGMMFPEWVRVGV